MRNIFVVIIALAAIVNGSPEIHRPRENVDTCGVARYKELVELNGRQSSFPWTVALMYKASRPPKFFCGATLISKSFVITAAHCIHDKNETMRLISSDILAIFGAFNLSDPHEAGILKLTPKKIYIHEDWNPMTKNYDADLSLLKFDRRQIKFNYLVQPICLWSSDDEPSEAEGIVTIWNQSEDEAKNYKDPFKPHETVPKIVEIGIQPNEICFSEDREVSDLSSGRTLCASYRESSGICRGDSGAGLFIKVDGVYYLRGIVSPSLLNNNGCEILNNTISTNVLEFQDWITTIAKGSLFNPAASTVYCLGDKERSSIRRTCRIDQAIDSKAFFFSLPESAYFYVVFNASSNKQLKFLPRDIGRKLPNLETFSAYDCGLTIIRDFYFKNMRKLGSLLLAQNEITTIETSAFDDLVNLRHLSLWHNRISTLEENIFVEMVNLEAIDLGSNMIKFLSPTTFKLPDNGKLKFVDLTRNFCIDEEYSVETNLYQLKSDLKTKCSK